MTNGYFFSFLRSGWSLSLHEQREAVRADSDESRFPAGLGGLGGGRERQVEDHDSPPRPRQVGRGLHRGRAPAEGLPLGGGQRQPEDDPGADQRGTPNVARPHGRVREHAAKIDANAKTG